MNDYYKVLKINHFASRNEIKRAYRFLAKKWHPDQNPDDENSTEMFKIINEAYSVLSNPVSKSKYDYKLMTYIVNLNINQVKAGTSEPDGGRNESHNKNLLNKLRTLVEELVFEEEHPEKMGYLKLKLLNLSKTRRVKQLRTKLIDLIYEDRD